jgi:hypothetical protein
VGLHPPPRAGRDPRRIRCSITWPAIAVRYYEDFVKAAEKIPLT